MHGSPVDELEQSEDSSLRFLGYTCNANEHSAYFLIREFRKTRDSDFLRTMS